MDLQHPCTLIWDGSQTEVCAPQWTSCWTKENCDSLKTDSSTDFVVEEEESSDVDPKSNFNINSLYLPMFLLTLYLNVNTSHN